MDVARTARIAIAPGLSLLSQSALAQDTTPLQCERLTVANTGSWAAPILRDFCETQEAHTAQAFAKILGKPRPSTEVYLLPAYGSAEATRTGLACVGGTAMRRLSNGWEQLRNATYNWVRCKDISRSKNAVAASTAWRRFLHGGADENFSDRNIKVQIH